MLQVSRLLSTAFLWRSFDLVPRTQSVLCLKQNNGHQPSFSTQVGRINHHLSGQGLHSRNSFIDQWGNEGMEESENVLPQKQYRLPSWEVHRLQPARLTTSDLREIFQTLLSMLLSFLFPLRPRQKGSWQHTLQVPLIFPSSPLCFLWFFILSDTSH